jgi:GT2 family glycosyltransferase
MLREPVRPVERWMPLDPRWRDWARQAEAGTPTVRPPKVSIPLRLPASDTPVVSIVVPVHGHVELTETCLLSLQASPPETPFEVVVVDDASPDDTLEVLGHAEGVRVVPLNRNVGFVRACNAGIRVARGDAVLLLNNDTIVLPGAVDALVRRLLDHDDVGVVGGQLLYPDGALQEAGGIVWDDGRAWNVGRDQDPDRSMFGHVREVDYCSGAALCVRAELLRRLGGLDERFAPAYYEDTDVCFAARAAGWRVLYEPMARIVHLEGRSHGTDTLSGTKRYQERNRRLFAQKWAAVLHEQHPFDPDHVLRAMQRRAPSTIVVVDHTVPTFDRDGGSMRMYQLLRILRGDDHDVIFVPSNGALEEPYTRALQELGIHVVGGEGDVAPLLVELLVALGDAVSVVILSRRDVAAHFLPLVRAASPDVPIVFDTVDVHFLREEREAELLDDADARERATAMRQVEEQVMRNADLTLVVSDAELEIIRNEVPGVEVAILPNVHAAHPTPGGFHDRDGIVFVGSYQHPPNVDAVLWFVDAVLPLVHERLPEVTFHVVGSGVPESIRLLASPRVAIEGWVPDLTDVYARARVAVAPLRYGAGMKGKVVDALAHGVPVVATAHGTEGMPEDVTRLVDVADDAAGLADHLIRLLTDEAAWTERHQAGPAAVDARYGIAPVAEQLRALLRALAAP